MILWVFIALRLPAVALGLRSLGPQAILPQATPVTLGAAYATDHACAYAGLSLSPRHWRSWRPGSGCRRLGGAPQCVSCSTSLLLDPASAQRLRTQLLLTRHDLSRAPFSRQLSGLLQPLQGQEHVYALARSRYARTRGSGFGSKECVQNFLLTHNSSCANQFGEYEFVKYFCKIFCGIKLIFHHDQN